MCLLIVLHGIDPDYPILVASNRDEERARKAAPPGLFVGASRRILSPRDRRAGGTWIGVNDLGMFAGLTNLRGAFASGEELTSRGELPHRALDKRDLTGAVEAVEQAFEDAAFEGFQLVLASSDGGIVLTHDGGKLERHAFGNGSAVVVSNEHRPGELELPGLEAASERGLSLDARFDALRALLLDRGESSGHRVLKVGNDYGTVSSSLIAVKPGAPRDLVWRYAPGPPHEAEYRNYGNLSRRLVEG